MNKKRNFAKVLIIIIILLAVTIGAIKGITSITKALKNKDEVGETTGPTLTSPSTEETLIPSESKETLQPTKTPEDKNSIISFENDSLIISNPGTDFDYTYKTNSNVFTIILNDRITENLGTVNLVNNKYFESYSINEEQETIKIEMGSEKIFTFTVIGSENSIIFEFKDVANSNVIIYRNDLDRHHMLIDEAALCARSDSENKYYEETFDSTNMVKTIKIKAERMPDLIDEVVLLSDGYLESYEIKNENGYIKMIFRLDEDLTLYPNSRDYNSSLSFIKNRDSENLIVIDPGHGGLDGGTVSPGEFILEKNVVLNISIFVADELRNMGYNVYNLREEDVFLGLKERTDIANLLNASSIISIHANSYNNTSVNGTLTIYKTSLDLARSIQNSIVSELGSTDIGLVKMMDRAILNGADMDSVIVETGFLTNPIEAEKLNTSEYQAKAAKGIANGIAGYYESKGEDNGN